MFIIQQGNTELATAPNRADAIDEARRRLVAMPPGEVIEIYRMVLVRRFVRTLGNRPRVEEEVPDGGTE